MSHLFELKRLRALFKFCISRLGSLLIIFPFLTALSPLWIPTFFVTWVRSDQRTRSFYRSIFLNFLNFWFPHRSLRRKSSLAYSTAVRIRKPSCNITSKKVICDLTNGEQLSATLFTCRGNLDSIPPAPVIIIRTPYARQNWVRMAKIFSSRGYYVLVQDTRGRFGSSGDFFPVKNEIEDGQLTIKWVREQRWCNQKVGTYGVSYMGLTALAAATGTGMSRVDCAFPVFASSRIFPIIKPHGSIAIDLGLRWLYIVMYLQIEARKLGKIKGTFWFLYRLLISTPKLDKSLMHLPLREADNIACGQTINFFQQAIHNLRGDEPFWEDADVLLPLDKFSPTPPPILWFAGWYDFFLDQQLKDFVNAVKVQPKTCLVVVNSSHWGLFKIWGMKIRHCIDWMDVHLKGCNPDKEFDSKPVRIYVMGANQWRYLATWPPEYCTISLKLSSGKKIVNIALIIQ